MIFNLNSAVFLVFTIETDTKQMLARQKNQRVPLGPKVFSQET